MEFLKGVKRTLRAAISTMQPKQQRVLILSFGAAGSYWLGQSLHRLQNVFCMVGADHPLSGLRYWYNDTEIKKLISLVQEGNLQKYGFSPNYMAINGQPVSSYHTMKSLGVDVFPRIANCGNIILEEMVETAALLRPNSRYLINVHGLHTLSYLQSPYRLNKKIKVYDLIRHPISTMDTWRKAFLWMWEHCEMGRKQLHNRYVAELAAIQEIEKKYHLSLEDPVNLMSYFAYLDIKTIANSFQLINCQRLKFEELKNQPEYFTKFYQSIFYRQPEKSYIDFIYSTENLTSGRVCTQATSGEPAIPKILFESWSTFQVDLFRDLVKHHHFKEKYYKYGYDLSFV